jgi:hypothetical protein
LLNCTSIHAGDPVATKHSAQMNRSPRVYFPVA